MANDMANKKTNEVDELNARCREYAADAKAIVTALLGNDQSLAEAMVANGPDTTNAFIGLVYLLLQDLAKQQMLPMRETWTNFCLASH
ncbi:hypothetical protein [Ferrimicrobium acidiphilum]|uniref:hypothetical protein n=1 Tax=Ferrimicrobium acidiphilum TaxID=121039 RepID=UPI0023F42DC4|nr:hypothetical protein [Ferrimicrobium acidiphilum]